MNGSAHNHRGGNSRCGGYNRCGGYARYHVTPAQMRELDLAAIREYGISGLILMETAASGIADYIFTHESELFNASADRPGRGVLVVCGRGNNGGDGFAVARKLHMREYNVLVLVLAARGDIGGDAATNMGICERLGIDMIFAAADTVGDIMPFCLARAVLIVDAIFGTGFHSRPEGVFETAIRAINGSRAESVSVVAVDTPSGLDARTGIAAGECVRADVTLALGQLKTGLICGPDAERAGAVELLDIGIPRELTDRLAPDTALTERSDVAALFGVRRRDAHKGDFGKLLIVTGSPGMTGAGCLTAAAALTAGSGLVYLAVPGSLAQIYETSIREAITLCAGANVDRTIGSDSADAIARYAGRMDAVAIGPGLSTEADTARAIRGILAAVEKPVVIDADALTAVALDIGILQRFRAPAVLTPHEGEMARLLGIKVAEVSRNRLALAREFAAAHGVTLVLKGHRSIVATPEGKVYVNTTGNPGMATAGSGDALTGVIASLLGAGMSAPDAARAGVYVHGLAGDLAAQALGERSVRASDIIRHLPGAFKRLEADGRNTIYHV